MTYMRSNGLIRAGEFTVEPTCAREIVALPNAEKRSLSLRSVVPVNDVNEHWMRRMVSIAAALQLREAPAIASSLANSVVRRRSAA